MRPRHRSRKCNLRIAGQNVSASGIGPAPGGAFESSFAAVDDKPIPEIEHPKCRRKTNGQIIVAKDLVAIRTSELEGLDGIFRYDESCGTCKMNVAAGKHGVYFP